MGRCSDLGYEIAVAVAIEISIDVQFFTKKQPFAAHLKTIYLLRALNQFK